MTGGIWSNVVTGICTLLAGLGGVWLTQHATHSRWLNERREVHRLEQRSAVVDLLTLGPDWRRAMMEYLNVMAKVIHIQVEPVARPEEARWKEQYHSFGRALMVARVTVTDHKIADLLWALTEFNEDSIEEWYVKAANSSEQTKTHHLVELDNALDGALYELEDAASIIFGALPTKQRPRVKRQVKR